MIITNEMFSIESIPSIRRPTSDRVASSSSMAQDTSPLGFSDEFDAQRRTIAGEIERLKSLHGEKPARDLVRARVEQLHGLIDSFQSFLQDRMPELNPWEQARSKQLLSELRENLAAAQELLQPRQKFRFRSRKPRRQAPPPIMSHVDDVVPEKSIEAKSPTQLIPPESSAEEISSAESETPSLLVEEGMITIRNFTQTLICLTADPKSAGKDSGTRYESISSIVKSVFPGGMDLSHPPVWKTIPDTGERDFDLEIENLNSCVVVICLEGLGAARLSHLRGGCRVFLSPVASSIHLEHVSGDGSLLALCGRQIRAHHLASVTLYQACPNNPIIETCTGLRIAPYNLRYPKLLEHLEVSDLASVPLQDDDAITDWIRTTKWSQIHDFDWLKQQASPHWAAIPESERLPEVDPVQLAHALKAFTPDHR